MTPGFESDAVFDLFDNELHSTYTQQNEAPLANKREQKEKSERPAESGRSSIMQPGRRVGMVEVLGPYWKKGRYGWFSDGEYRAKCLAPEKLQNDQQPNVKRGVCGKEFLTTYMRLYQGTVFSCGCTARPKHPPVRLEGLTIGKLEVLRWAEDYEDVKGVPVGAWECLCHDCGAILYRRTAKEARATAVEDCGEHEKE